MKADFPALRQKMNGRSLAYLDTAASAQKPQAVIDAVTRAYTDHYANIHRGLYEFSQKTTADFEAARKRIARFMGVSNENEIVFTRNATESINLVAQSWGRTNLKAGDEILLTEMEHHANIVPWQLLRDQTGVVLKIAPIFDDGALDLESYKNLLGPRTRLVAVTHVSNALGIINPVKKIAAAAKNFNSGIKVLVDGSQAVVHMPVNVPETGCDFYAFTGHKLYGPTGVGVLWGRAELLNAMPPYQGGGDMIERVMFEKTTYKDAPARFEAGTPAIAEAIGLGAAVDYLDKAGMKSVAARENALLDYAMKELDKIDGLRFYGTAKAKAGIVSFTAGWGHPSDIGMILDQCGVAVRTGHHCCMPLMQRFGIDGTIRASFGLYTEESDIDALAEGLKKAKSMLS
ncbi:MAG: cysteine desulfurase [Proteobacteria bacterium]|nr:cysteine desulfurase [Pseudomonadota bacterium]